MFIKFVNLHYVIELLRSFSNAFYLTLSHETHAYKNVVYQLHYITFHCIASIMEAFKIKHRFHNVKTNKNEIHRINNIIFLCMPNVRDIQMKPLSLLCITVVTFLTSVSLSCL